MLGWRLILSAVFIAGLVGVCWLDYRAAQPGAYLLPLAVVIGLLAAGELSALFRKRGHQPLSWVVYVGVLIPVLSAGASIVLPNGPASSAANGGVWLAAGLAVALLIAMIGELRRFQTPGTATVNLAFSALAILYVGGLLSFLILLRCLAGLPWGNDGRWGMIALVSLIVTVKMSDVGQYTAGRLFGRHKLAPTISPGKTWEGAVGGLLFAIISAWLVLGWIAGTVVGLGGTVRVAVFGIVLAAAGILGDLAESMLKRDAGVKDSSNWLPGFGGVLDLLDSLLGAAPVAYLFWVLRWVGP